MLAGDIGERQLWRPAALERAARYSEATWQAQGYQVARQSVVAEGETVYNLETEFLGGPRRDEIVVVGGHYDSVLGSPGANDNATGTAAVLELARLLAGQQRARTVRFVAFVNEEAPFFQTDAMGSWVYARRSHARGEQVVAMLAIETIGFYSDVAGSQHYPFPFGLFYPHTGNFIGFVGNIASRALVRRTHCGLSPAYPLPFRRRRSPRLDDRYRLVRPLGLLARGLPWSDGHGHGPVPLCALPQPRGHARPDQL
jgi:hypothetical protein